MKIALLLCKTANGPRFIELHSDQPYFCKVRWEGVGISQLPVDVAGEWA